MVLALYNQINYLKENVFCSYYPNVALLYSSFPKFWKFSQGNVLLKSWEMKIINNFEKPTTMESFGKTQTYDWFVNIIMLQVRFLFILNYWQQERVALLIHMHFGLAPISCQVSYFLSNNEKGWNLITDRILDRKVRI